MGTDPAGAAAAAGVQKGDVITEVNGSAVHSGSELSEQIARLKPGDKVALTLQRNGSATKVEATLKGKLGNMTAGNGSSVSALGADFAALSRQDAARLGVSGGVQVQSIEDGGLLDEQTNMKEGFVITRVGGIPVRSVEELKAALARQNGNYQIEGTYPGSGKTYYYGINEN